MRRIAVVGMVILAVVAMPVIAGAKAGDKPAKVTICHVPDDGGTPHFIEVNAKAVAAHEAHGDYPEACEAPSDEPTDNLPPTASILASPQCSWSGECSYLVLYSSGSADPEGNDLTYFWTVTGSDGTTVNYMTSSVTIMLAGQTSFLVTLVVSDGELLSEPAQAFVEIP